MTRIITYEVTFAIDDDRISASEIEEQIWNKDWKGVRVINTVDSEVDEIDFEPVIL